MIYIIMGLSLLFMATGFIVTEKNAKYLLSGYNTMSSEDRIKVDIRAYIGYFRKFHLFLGISLLMVGISLTYFINANAGGIFITIYPILAYFYFVTTGSKYAKGFSNKGQTVGLVVLAGTLLIVIGLLGYGMKEDRLVINSNGMELTGSYGETLTQSEIQSMKLVNQLPEISIKTNGFALGSIRKGYFKTKEGEVVKLIMNAESRRIMLITKNSGEKIYYTPKNPLNEEWVDKIKEVFPNIQ